MSDEVKATETATVATEPVKPAEPAPIAEPVKAEPEPAPTPKERIQEIAAALTHASPSGVEALAGELAELAAAL